MPSSEFPWVGVSDFAIYIISKKNNITWTLATLTCTNVAKNKDIVSTHKKMEIVFVSVAAF